MKHVLRAALAIFALAATLAIPAAAQNAQTSVYDYPGQLVTYSAVSNAFAPASSATDFLTIAGSSTKRIRIRKVHCDGSSTAAASAYIQLVKRSAVDTGTQVALTAVPYNSGNSAAVATVGTYAANPTLGTAVGVVAEGYLNTGPLTAANGGGVTWDLSNQSVFLIAATEELAINLNATSLTSGASVNCSVEWAEQ